MSAKCKICCLSIFDEDAQCYGTQLADGTWICDECNPPDRITALAAVVTAAEARAPATVPTEAEHVEGCWMLKGQTKATGGTALSIDHYGLRVQTARVGEESGEIRIDPYAHGAYLTGEAVIDLRKHLDGLWQCDKCNRWMRGAGICALCGGKG